MKIYCLTVLLIINTLSVNFITAQELPARQRKKITPDEQNPEERLKKFQNHDMEINMAIKYNPAFREIEANDDAAKMKVRLGKSFGEEYNISVRMVNKSEYGKIKEIKRNKNKFYYEYSGLGINLVMEKVEDTKYLISGSLKIGSKIRKAPKVILVKRIEGNEIIYEADEPDITIGSDRYYISASLNTRRFNKRAFGGVVSFILVLRYQDAAAKLPSKNEEIPQPQK